MSEIIIYEPADGGQVTVRLEGQSLWLTQEQMAELFGRERSVITKHLKNVFREGELEERSVCAKFAHTAGDGKTYQTQGRAANYQRHRTRGIGAAYRRVITDTKGNNDLLD